MVIPSMPAIWEAAIAVSQLYGMVGVASWAPTLVGIMTGMRARTGMIAAVAARLMFVIRNSS
jgi:hypothetical protein